MDMYVEQYQATHGGVTLHTWRDMPGGKKGELLYDGRVRYPGSLMVPDTLRTKHLPALRDFP